MNDELTCLRCPIGCRLEIRKNGKVLTVIGNKCDKGQVFAIEEILHPKRNIATTIPIDGEFFNTLSVRLSENVPREIIRDIVAAIHKIKVIPPINRGDVLATNILNSGADVIATRSIRDRSKGQRS